MTEQSPHISIYDPASGPATQALLREIGAAPNRTMGQNFSSAAVFSTASSPQPRLQKRTACWKWDRAWVL
jgi:hypothetical protein